ncbi:MAG TPA: hypothetical protein VH969_23765 [Actinophytocola sp.]|uniref:hypothetical protein n=1 Tax=Actinophytocola sp. TaxID=1872138 RepID=UPI002F92C82F
MRNPTQLAAGPVTAAGTPEMLLDHYLPHYSVTLAEHAIVDADVATTWRALRELDLLQVHTPLLDAAFFVRGLPQKLATLFGRATPTEVPARLTLSGDGGGLAGWLSLGQVPEREIVLGAVGRFWQPNIEWYDVTTMTPDEFAAFAEPGWGRIAAGLSLRPYGKDRTLVSYEARTAINDRTSARRFAWYWLIVSPFVAHVMRAVLTTLRENCSA